MPKIRAILNLNRPIQLVIALLEYGLGLGLARYLGATIQVGPQYLGGAIVLLILSASYMLAEYFRPNNEPTMSGETPGEREDLRQILLVLSISLLVTAVICIFLLQRSGYFKVETSLLVSLFVILAMGNAVPPVRFSNRGLSELSSAIILAGLIPSLAFVFQFGSFNRILSMYTFPLFMLALAYLLALNFPAYVGDLKYERRSLLMSIGWQRGVLLHNILLIAAYLLFAALPFLGIPFDLVWPSLLTLPLAAYQVFVFRNLVDGAKPIWSAFIANSSAVYGLTIYLVALTFWLR